MPGLLRYGYHLEDHVIMTYQSVNLTCQIFAVPLIGQSDNCIIRTNRTRGSRFNAGMTMRPINVSATDAFTSDARPASRMFRASHTSSGLKVLWNHRTLISDTTAGMWYSRLAPAGHEDCIMRERL